MVLYLSDKAIVAPDYADVEVHDDGDETLNCFSIAAAVGQGVNTYERVWIVTDSEALESVAEYWRSRGKFVVCVPHESLEILVAGEHDASGYNTLSLDCYKYLSEFLKTYSVASIADILGYWNIDSLLDVFLSHKELASPELIWINDWGIIQQYLDNFISTGDIDLLKGQLQEFIDKYGAAVINNAVHTFASRRLSDEEGSIS